MLLVAFYCSFLLPDWSGWMLDEWDEWDNPATALNSCSCCSLRSWHCSCGMWIVQCSCVMLVVHFYIISINPFDYFGISWYGKARRKKEPRWGEVRLQVGVISFKRLFTVLLEYSMRWWRRAAKAAIKRHFENRKADVWFGGPSIKTGNGWRQTSQHSHSGPPVAAVSFVYAIVWERKKEIGISDVLLLLLLLVQ